MYTLFLRSIIVISQFHQPGLPCVRSLKIQLPISNHWPTEVGSVSVIYLHVVFIVSAAFDSKYIPTIAMFLHVLLLGPGIITFQS